MNSTNPPTPELLNEWEQRAEADSNFGPAVVLALIHRLRELERLAGDRENIVRTWMRQTGGVEL